MDAINSKMQFIQQYCISRCVPFSLLCLISCLILWYSICYWYLLFLFRLSLTMAPNTILTEFPRKPSHSGEMLDITLPSHCPHPTRWYAPPPIAVAQWQNLPETFDSQNYFVFLTESGPGAGSCQTSGSWYPNASSTWSTAPAQPTTLLVTVTSTIFLCTPSGTNWWSSITQQWPQVDIKPCE